MRESSSLILVSAHIRTSISSMVDSDSSLQNHGGLLKVQQVFWFHFHPKRILWEERETPSLVGTHVAKVVTSHKVWYLHQTAWTCAWTEIPKLVGVTIALVDVISNGPDVVSWIWTMCNTYSFNICTLNVVTTWAKGTGSSHLVSNYLSTNFSIWYALYRKVQWLTSSSILSASTCSDWVIVLFEAWRTILMKIGHIKICNFHPPYISLTQHWVAAVQ